MHAEFSRVIGKLVWPDKPRSALARYSFAVVLPLIAILVSSSAFTYARAPFFVLFTLSVMFSAVYGGWKPGLVCTVVSLLATSLELPPRFSLHVTDRETLARMLVFFLAGAIISAFIDVIGALQQKLDEQRERYRVTLSSIGDAVIATDTNGLVTFMNAVAEDATGWSHEQGRGRSLEEVFHIVNAQTRKPAENPIRKVFETGRVVGLANHTLLIRRDGSELPIDDSAAPIRDKRGRVVGAVLVFRDITEQQQRDRALIHSEKLASAGRLAATIAHEINNPLEAISNLLYLIQSSKDPAEIEQYAATAEHELTRASEIAKQTLSFARRESKHELIDVTKLVDGVLVLFANKIQNRRISVQKVFESQVYVFGTSSEVRQVFGNLIGNALDAMPGSGTLHIRLKSRNAGGRPAAQILIADTGHGISADDMPKLFEPFFTKKDVGTGLGLWLTKQIVDAHSGKIRVRSAPGRGTVVGIYWPAAKERIAEGETFSASTQ